MISQVIVNTLIRRIFEFFEASVSLSFKWIINQFHTQKVSRRDDNVSCSIDKSLRGRKKERIKNLKEKIKPPDVDASQNETAARE